MNVGMELMGMKECRECGDPYTPPEGDAGICGGCIQSREIATLRARVAELEVELDAARRVIETNGQLISHEARALEAEATVARLREALKRELPDEARPYSLESADAAHHAREVSRCARVNEQRNRILTALASVPSAEPTPRDMRVAEAVYFDALSDFLPEGLHARDREHLAAVVAKALEVGT